ncbi:MAG: hypothetical protein R2831_10185 [Chitinophagaceae bacterium]
MVWAADLNGGVNAYEYSGTNNTKGAVNAYSYRGVGVVSNADSNQAGVFTAGNSTPTGSLYQGVLRGEYTGSLVADYVGVYGYSIPNAANNYGIGVRGEGGYRGVYGYGVNTSGSSTFGVYGYANGTGTNYGVYGSTNGTGTTDYAGYFSGTLYATTLTGGTKPFTIDHPLDPENKFLRQLY